jgi:hypothetical protein
VRGLLASDPGSPPLLRDGFPEYTAFDSPAAGADFVASIDGRFYERLLTVWCRLVTSADVANREVVLQFLNPAGDVIRSCGAATTVAAVSTYDYSFSVWQPTAEWPVDTGILVPLDPLILPPTFGWQLHVVNVEATDALSRIRVFRERFWSDSPVPGRDYGDDQ